MCGSNFRWTSADKQHPVTLPEIVGFWEVLSWISWKIAKWVIDEVRLV